MKIWLLKFIGNKIFKAIKYNRDMKRLKDYVEKPNELDKEVKNIYKELKLLKKDSHSKADWVCLECGCKAVEKKSRKARRRKRRLIKKGE